jgi:hypothetical protein
MTDSITGRDGYIVAQALYEFIKVQEFKTLKEGREWSNEQDAKAILLGRFGDLYKVFVEQDQRRGVTPADLVDEKEHPVDDATPDDEAEGCSAARQGHQARGERVAMRRRRLVEFFDSEHGEMVGFFDAHCVTSVEMLRCAKNREGRTRCIITGRNDAGKEVKFPAWVAHHDLLTLHLGRGETH